MIGWLIVLGIAVLLAVILTFPVCIHLSYQNPGEGFRVVIRHMGIQHYPRKEKKRKKKKKDKKSVSDGTGGTSAKNKNLDTAKEQSPDASSTEEKGKAEGNTPPESQDDTVESPGGDEEAEEKTGGLLEKVKVVKNYIEDLAPIARRLAKGIWFDHLKVEAEAGAREASAAAIRYGELNILLYNILSFLRCFFTVGLEKMDISCHYEKDKTEIRASCVVKASCWVLIVVFGGVLKYFLLRTIRLKRELKRQNADNQKKGSGNLESPK